MKFYFSALPLLLSFSFLAFFLIIFGRIGRRDAFLKSSLICAMLASLSAEGLSFFRILNFQSLIYFWSLICVVIFALTLTAIRSRREKLMLKFDFQPLPRYWIVIFVSLLSITALTALFSPPNTWDSMVYHMTRVEHWLGQGSLRHYATDSTKQLFLNPFAEILILHFQILLGNSDRLANLVQWFSYLGCLIGISLIIKELGGSLRSQILGALIVGTSPMILLQATSTQNDLVCAYLIGCTVLFILRSMLNNRLSNIVYLSLALALAVETKGTAYIFLPTFLFWTATVQARRKNLKQIVLISLFSVFLITLLNGPHWLRNYDVWNNPLGDSPILSGLNNEIHGPAVVISNIIRNLSIQLATPISEINDVVAHSIIWFHRNILRLDPSDPRITYAGLAFEIKDATLHEDYAANPLQIILFILTMVFFLKRREKIHNDVFLFLIAIIASFVIFCLLLKWQPWHSRLLVPLLVLASVPIAFFIDALLENKFLKESSVFGVLVVTSLPWLFLGMPRPFISIHHIKRYSVLTKPRDEQYFVNRPRLLDSFTDLFRQLTLQVKKSHCQIIGLKEGGDSWEYPLWMLSKSKGYVFRFIPIDVAGASGKIRDPEVASVCAYVTLDQDVNWRPSDPRLKGMPLLWSSGPLRLYGLTI